MPVLIVSLAISTISALFATLINDINVAKVVPCAMLSARTLNLLPAKNSQSPLIAAMVVVNDMPNVL